MARTNTTFEHYNTFSEYLAIVAPRAAPCWNCFEIATKNTPRQYGSLSYRDSRRSHSAEELLPRCNMQPLTRLSVSPYNSPTQCDAINLP